MKKIVVLIFSFVAILSLPAVSIYDVQYTVEAGSGDYPSLYLDQQVTLTGIVTCNNYNGDKFLISSPGGGAWNGILIYESGNGLQLGDEVEVTGTVAEYYGLTEIQYATDITILSSGNEVPSPAVITTSDFATMEAYEGVLVQMVDVDIVALVDEWDIYCIDDGSGYCQVGTYCINPFQYGFELELGMTFTSIIGCGTYSYGAYELAPRDEFDIELGAAELRLTLPEIVIGYGGEFNMPVNIYAPENDTLLTEIALTISFDPGIIHLADVELEGSLLEGLQPEIVIENDHLTFNIQADLPITQNADLFYLRFQTQNEGTSQVSFQELIINGEVFDNYRNGSVYYQELPGMSADEITLIQRPILSIPEIAVAGTEFQIICQAPSSVQDWSAALQWQDISLQLAIDNTGFDESSGLWELTVIAPYAAFYTLYDLRVYAAGVDIDTAENAVFLIPEYKSDYYFVHITDTHLPGHEFWGDDPNGVDFTEIDDLRNIIKTVNLIRPEFVLLTGDVVNEGELEDLNGRHVYSLAKNLLTELDVPVFLTSGNHDIGGWDDTSPPDGTARHNWHRFFGWEFLENAAAGSYTQDYTFTYDNTLFIGMEGYINYDGYQYGIFGDSSFTYGQMSWLNDVIAMSTEEARVAFYHYDFDEEINLGTLGLDMALWGHIHSNSGNINQQPYDLSTAATCDGNGAFRVINVSDNVLQPYNTCYATDLPDISFTYPNYGQYDQNTAVINNDYNLDFYQSQITFIMPHAESYETDLGNIAYIHDIGLHNEVAVRFELPASGTATINISAINTGVAASDIPGVLSLGTYPNPANPDMTIAYYLPQDALTEITLYNIRGQKVTDILSEWQTRGAHSLAYKPLNKASGIYFLKIAAAGQQKMCRVLLLK
ncbi:MAG: metallophosphoesterase [Candidatus Cloacimonetes bacterium]|nr:metallophosphoesterase [Candidatus Cloacimonadota bacterium]